MKFFLLISILSLLSLCPVFAEKSDKISLNNDELDVVDLVKDDTYTKSSDAQRKRDSGYSYTRPGRFSSLRHEPKRGRIVTKYPSNQTIRPFNRYGPPKQTSPQFVKPSDQYAPQHLHIGGHRLQQQHRYLHPQQSGFTNQGGQFNVGQMHQGIPSPIRNNDFMEPSPIASQNNEPFNSNAANYLPPRNQKLPGHLNPNQFANEFQQPSNQHQSQNSNNQFQSQRLVQGRFEDSPQISDAALFLNQNAQAISQLYETPASNLNYEPIQDSQVSLDQSENPNNQFQTLNVNDDRTQRLENFRGFKENLPSYASGFLDSKETLQQLESLEKDRLIVQLQRALNQGNSGNPSETSARHANNHHQVGNYIQTLGTQINPSIGQQPHKSNNFDPQRPYDVGNQAIGQGSFVPVTGTTTSGLRVTYGLPSPTAATQFPSSTAATSTTTSVAPQRPLSGTTTSDGTSQVGTSVLPSGPSLTFPFPQYGGFVPTLIGPNLVSSYPTYANSFLGSGSIPITPLQNSGSSPTHFNIPIPTIPSNTQGTLSTSVPTISPSVQTPSHHPGTHFHTIPVQPIQPIHPIAATPIHPAFPVSPTVTHVHPVQSPVASGHPNYSLQPTPINPILIKPVKSGVYPLYFYQLQKPNVSNIPWSYAPSYAQVKPQQAWK